eukprot:TRINITY_DN10675_c0_g1_i14.p1 TRINITY_DN10675_c0_g1~~TRINITY_DN10675_c0_g1_i14.p1  ORF type:complete len:435 (-),score=126.22 TRINITY_DN10675_c0_g1_i14:944-2248(-)
MNGVVENGENKMEDKSKSGLPAGKYKVVIYDFETTGKSLVDEICHIGCYANSPKQEEQVPVENGDGGEKDTNGESETKPGKEQQTTDPLVYSQYIMPHRNLSYSARNAHNLVVVSMDHQRMLRDTNSGRLVKTKSEISALQDWMKWLEKVKDDCDGIILVHHAHDKARDLQVPLLLISLARYNLVQRFSTIVKGFCNSVNVISDLGDKSLITSLSLRSLCKTVLKDTSLSTRTASHRCRRIHDILVQVVNDSEKETDNNNLIADKVSAYATSVPSEEAKVRHLEALQKAQYSMRPIFVEFFRDGYKMRTRMVGIRRCLAEHGLDYAKLTDLAKQDKLIAELEKVSIEDPDNKTLMVNTVKDHFKEKSSAKKNPSSPTVNGASEHVAGEGKGQGDGGKGQEDGGKSQEDGGKGKEDGDKGRGNQNANGDAPQVNN